MNFADNLHEDAHYHYKRKSVSIACTCFSRSASEASLPKTEDQMAEDGDPTKTQPVKDPSAVLTKALKLVDSPDENWCE